MFSFKKAGAEWVLKSLCWCDIVGLCACSASMQHCLALLLMSFSIQKD